MLEKSYVECAENLKFNRHTKFHRSFFFFFRLCLGSVRSVCRLGSRISNIKRKIAILQYSEDILNMYVMYNVYRDLSNKCVGNI